MCFLGAIRVQNPSSCPTLWVLDTLNTGLLNVRMLPFTSLPPPVGISLSVIACSITWIVAELACAPLAWALAAVAEPPVAANALAVSAAETASVNARRRRLLCCKTFPPLGEL